jgi:hypothetical protein
MLLSDTQQANLLSALGDRGLSSGKARGVMALVTPGLEFDADDVPTNLDGAVDAAKLAYGDIFGRDTGPTTADEVQAAKDAGMTPERYEALKGVRNIADWNALGGGAAA